MGLIRFIFTKRGRFRRCPHRPQRGKPRRFVFAWVLLFVASGVHAADVAVVRGKILADETGDPSGVKQYAGVVMDLLEPVVDFETFDDAELTRRDLSKYKLLILPHNPRLSATEIESLARYTRAGGKLLHFYNLPPKLAPVLGIDKFAFREAGKNRPFQSIQPTGKLVGELPGEVFQGSWAAHVPTALAVDTNVIGRWRDAAGRLTAHAAIVESPRSIFVGHVLLPTDIPAKRRLLVELIGRLLPARLATMRGALAKYVAELETAATATPAAPMAMRGVWLDLRDPIPDASWAEAIDRMAEAGLTDVFVLVATGGLAQFPTEHLPVADGIDGDHDPLAEIVAAAKPHGLRVHAWKVCWNAHDAPPEFINALRSNGRLQVDIHGKVHNWLSPSHWSNYLLEQNVMLELVGKYDLAGIHFDFIRYPNSYYDFSPIARERFEQHIGRAVANWPADVRRGPLKAKFIEWRQWQITRLVRETAKKARQLKPGLKVSAAVFPHYPKTKETIGQNWLDWAQRGDVDFLVPMNYTRSETQFAKWTSSHLRYVQGTNVPLYPGIGATVGQWQSPLETARQIRIAHQLGASGYVLFHYDHTLAKFHLPLLRLGVNRTAR